MRSDEIDALPAGRELDALVAEKVMHERLPPSGYDTDVAVRAEHIGGGGYVRRPVPAYSTDIAAAWKVVKKMDADGFGWAIADDEVYFAKGDPDSPDYRFGGVALPLFTDKTLAICRAALKAVGA